MFTYLNDRLKKKLEYVSEKEREILTTKMLNEHLDGTAEYKMYLAQEAYRHRQNLYSERVQPLIDYFDFQLIRETNWNNFNRKGGLHSRLVRYRLRRPPPVRPIPATITVRKVEIMIPPQIPSPSSALRRQNKLMVPKITIPAPALLRSKTGRKSMSIPIPRLLQSTNL